jgi:hypothetical protein
METSDNIVHGKNNTKRQRQGHPSKDHEKSPRHQNSEIKGGQKGGKMKFSIWAAMRKRFKKKPALPPVFNASDLEPRTCNRCSTLFYVLRGDDRRMCLRCTRSLLRGGLDAYGI